MTSATETPNKALWDSLVGILEDAAADLAVDERTVTVHRRLMDQAFSQRSFPMVVVVRPRMSDVGPWTYRYDRRELEVDFLLVDGCGVAPGDMDDAHERLDRLWERVHGVLCENGNRHLGVPELHVFYSLGEWEQLQVENSGNNLLVRGWRLTLPTYITRALPEA
jgi:hypothetical protein